MADPDVAPVRGPDAVRQSLIQSATQLMAMRSPRHISGRELAKHAGVNYGLIHHYFGTKDAVFAAAVTESTDEMAKRWDEDGILPVNTSDAATSYRTFAKLEVDEALSPMTALMRRIVNGQVEVTGRAANDRELLAEVALCAALQFGWGAFEQEIIAGLAQFGADQDDIRERVAELSMRLQDDD